MEKKHVSNMLDKYSLILGLLWIFAVFLTGPLQEFPLNDDFAHCQDVKSLLDGNGLTVSEYTDTSLIAQTLWGALFCLPFGFSIAALKLSVIVAGLAGLLLTYGVLNIVSANRLTNILFTACLAFCPLYFVLSISFMTDVPFYVLSVGIIYCYLMHFSTREIKWLFFSALVTILAILVRQYGLLYTFALVPALFLQERYKLFSKPVLMGLLNVAVAVLVLIIYSVWLKTTRAPEEELNSKIGDILRNFGRGGFYLAGRFSFITFAYLGYISLFLTPLLVSFYLKFWQKLSSKQQIIRSVLFTFLIGLALYLLIHFNYTFPYLMNYIYNFGLGPVLIENVYKPISWVYPFFIFLTFLSLVSLTFWADLLVSSNKFEISFINVVAVFSVLFIIGYSLVTSLIFPFDRYCLVLFPMVALLVAKLEFSIRRPAFPIVLIALMGLFSVAGSHDYFAWNSIRWNLGNALIKKGISPRAIDGGFEFNAWYLYDPHYQTKPGKNIWWVEDDLYQISNYPVTGRKVIEKTAYKSWLHFFSTETIYLTKREN